MRIRSLLEGEVRAHGIRCLPIHDEVGTAKDVGDACEDVNRADVAVARLTKTIRTHKDGIMAAIELGVSNGRVEGSNTKIRYIIARCYGLHSAQATLALVMLSCGPIDLKLPYERAS